MPFPEDAGRPRGRVDDPAGSPADPPERGDDEPGRSPPPSASEAARAAVPDARYGPSVLELARLSPRSTLTPGREELYRHIARLVELGEGDEFLIVPSGSGEATRFLARLTEAAGAGVDPDDEMVDRAEERAREAGQSARVHFDRGDPDDLPYKDHVFDMVIGEVGLAAAEDPGRAVQELVRVAKPMGTVVLVVPFWTQSVDERRREVLTRRLGMKPALVQRWKHVLRDAGVVELYVEDLSEPPSSRPGSSAPNSLADLLWFRERLAIIWAAWKRWGWRGVTAVLGREQELRRLTGPERVLGLCMIKGTRWPEEHNPS